MQFVDDIPPPGDDDFAEPASEAEVTPSEAEVGADLFQAGGNEDEARARKVRMIVASLDSLGCKTASQWRHIAALLKGYTPELRYLTAEAAKCGNRQRKPPSDVTWSMVLGELEKKAKALE